jgi:hypothetical protein
MERVVLLMLLGRPAATLPGHRRLRSAQQGHALPVRSADRRGDRPGDAPCRDRARLRLRGRIVRMRRAGLRISKTFVLTALAGGR